MTRTAQWHILVIAAFQLPCWRRGSGPGPLALLRRRGVGNHRYRYGAAAASLKPPAAAAPQRPPRNIRPLRYRCCNGRYAVFTAHSTALSRFLKVWRHWRGQRKQRRRRRRLAYTVALHTQSHTKTTHCQQRYIVKALILRCLLSSA